MPFRVQKTTPYVVDYKSDWRRLPVPIIPVIIRVIIPVIIIVVPVRAVWVFPIITAIITTVMMVMFVFATRPYQKTHQRE